MEVDAERKSPEPSVCTSAFGFTSSVPPAPLCVEAEANLRVLTSPKNAVLPAFVPKAHKHESWPRGWREEKTATEIPSPKAHNPSHSEGKQASPLLMGSLCTISALEGADQALLPSVFFALQKDLRLNLTDLATMTMMQALTSSIFTPVWGILADRGMLKRKNIIIAGCILSGLITAVLALMNNLLIIVLLRGLNGAFLATLKPVSNAIIADVTSESQRGKSFGLVQLSFNIGRCLAVILGTPMSTQRIAGMQGWSVAFSSIGLMQMAAGFFCLLTLPEPPRERCARGQASRSSIVEELRRLVSLFKIPTFLALIVQGLFGCVPWSAIAYTTLFYQVAGLTDMQSAVITFAGLLGSALGSVLGGVVGDRLARWSPYHGRPLTAQISVAGNIPLIILILKVCPNETFNMENSRTFWYYLILTALQGLVGSWCSGGVNLPILSAIVPAQCRCTVIAWQQSLESICAAFVGNAMVGVLASKVFGYDNSMDLIQRMDYGRMRALGSALALTCVCPFVLCFSFYSLLHLTYRRDLMKLQEEQRLEREDLQKADTGEVEPNPEHSPEDPWEWNDDSPVSFQTDHSHGADRTPATRLAAAMAAAANLQDLTQFSQSQSQEESEPGDDAALP